MVFKKIRAFLAPTLLFFILRVPMEDNVLVASFIYSFIVMFLLFFTNAARRDAVRKRNELNDELQAKIYQLEAKVSGLQEQLKLPPRLSTKDRVWVFGSRRVVVRTQGDTWLRLPDDCRLSDEQLAIIRGQLGEVWYVSDLGLLSMRPLNEQTEGRLRSCLESFLLTPEEYNGILRNRRMRD